MSECELCTGPKPVVAYPVSEFTIMLPSRQRMTNQGGYWRACAVCRDVIEAGSLEGLVDQHLAVQRERHPELVDEQVLELLRQELRVSLGAVLEHRGAGVPLDQATDQPPLLD
jgi:hypothetical protein